MRSLASRANPRLLAIAEGSKAAPDKRVPKYNLGTRKKGSATIAVLELPPVISPKTAVQIAIFSEVKNQARK